MTSSREALFAVDRNVRQPREPENASRRRRHIDNPPPHEGTAIVDGHDHRMPIALVRYRDLRAQRQRAVGGGESFAIQFLTAGGSATAFNGVDRGNPDLIRRRTSEITGRKLTG